MTKREHGCLHVYTGNGKGKTTAALGLALRAAGHDQQVYILQFMKGDPEYGEVRMARRLAPLWTLEQSGRDCFVSRQQPAQVDKDMAQAGLEKARTALTSGQYQLIILDEFNTAVDFGLISLAQALELIAQKPAATELVLTGRYAPTEIQEKADLVTEMHEIKHYFQEGWTARTGIEA